MDVGEQDGGRVKRPRADFRKCEHIRKSAEIRELFKTGSRRSVPGAKLFFRPNGRPFSRIAFCPARSYRNAVSRNKAKRLGREAFRLCKARLRRGYDMVLLTYPAAESFDARVGQFTQLCRKAGLLSER